MKGYPATFESFQRKIIQMGASQKLQNSIQILIILCLVYPIHTNSLFQVIFEALSFSFSKYFNSWLRFLNLVDLSSEHLGFSNKLKTVILFPSPLLFLPWAIAQISLLSIRRTLLLPLLMFKLQGTTEHSQASNNCTCFSLVDEIFEIAFLSKCHH